MRFFKGVSSYRSNMPYTDNAKDLFGIYELMVQIKKK